jgi:molybdenum cofactor biosynthesis enzyme MoaA
MKNFCALPFHHVMVHTNGDYNVCCHHTRQSQPMNINKDNADSWLNSSYLSEVQQSFLSDTRHPGCHHCWSRENQGFPSLRQKTELEYKILKVNTEQKEITNVEINLGNLCNLKCLMCNESDSSAILAENIQLGINKNQQKDLSWSDTAFDNLQELLLKNPKVVNIRGGEPLYNKKLLELIENFPPERAKSIVLHITTNATHWDSQWERALAKFRLVRFMLSIDAVDNLYEYIRYPASWSVVQENVDRIIDLPNAKSHVAGVVQNLNIATIGNLIQWCNEKKLWLDLTTIIDPDYLQITNLPEKHKEIALAHLKSIHSQNSNPQIQDFINNSIVILTNSKFDENLWNKFVTNIFLRDSLRGNDYQKFITPSL